MDPAADQTGRQHVIAHGLADEENRDDRGYCRPSQPELHHCHGERHDKSRKRAEVGHETQQAGDEPKQQPVVQADRFERSCIEDGKDEADRALAVPRERA